MSVTFSGTGGGGGDTNNNVPLTGGGGGNDMHLMGSRNFLIWVQKTKCHGATLATPKTKTLFSRKQALLCYESQSNQSIEGGLKVRVA